MKTIWKIIIITIAVGFVLSLSGFLMGASRTLYWDRTGVYTNGNEICHITEPDVGYFKSIKIESSFSDVRFVSAEKYGIELYGDNMEWFWTIENDVLKITHSKNSRYPIINLNFLPIHKNYAIVYLPDTAELEKVNIKSNSGDMDIGSFHADRVELINTFGEVDLSDVTSDYLMIQLNSGDFTGSDINVRIFEYNNSFGDGNFKTVKADKLAADNNSGDLRFTGCEFVEVDIKNNFGYIRADRFSSTKSNIRANSGDINITGNLTGETVIHSDFGDIKLTVSEKKDNYSFDISVKFGDIKFDGERMGDRSLFRSSSTLENHLKISASSGDIDVKFE